MKKIAKKAIKVTVAVISALMVLAVTLPLLASLLLNLPGVQNIVAKRFMAVVSGNLGTTVSIDRIRVKLINRVEVDGFYVEDLHGDTLLYSKKIIAPIVELGLFGRPLTFGTVTLGDTELWLRRDSLDEINIHRMALAIRGGRDENPAGNFRMHVDGVDAPNITFGLLRWDKPLRGGVDFSRFVTHNTRVRVDGLYITGDTVRMGVRSLSFDERSGFRMENLSARSLVISGGDVLLDGVKIKAEGAVLDAPYIHLEGRDWQNYGSFMDSVAVNVALERSTVPAPMVGWFLPSVRDWDITLDNVSLATTGPVAAMEGDIANADVLRSSMSLAFRSRGLPKFDNLGFDADVRRLTTDAEDVEHVLRTVTGKPLPAGVARIAGRLGMSVITGKFTGGFNDFTATGVLASDLGCLTAGITMQDGGDVKRFDVHADVDGMDAGRLLDVRKLAGVSAALDAKGTLGRGGRIDGNIDGNVRSLAFGGYNYRGVTFDGRLAGKMFDGAIHSADPSLRFGFLGMLDFNSPVPRYNFDLDLRRADLAATRISNRDSVALLSARIDASGTGAGLDDLNGRIDIRDLLYIATADTIRSRLMTLEGKNSPDSKQIRFNSDFADADFHSRISYRDMFAYLGDFLHDYIPLLYSAGRDHTVRETSGIADAMNFSVLNLNVKDAAALLNVFAPGVQIGNDTEASFMFNPFVRSFALTARSEFIEYNGMFATDIELNSDNKADSLTLSLTGREFYRGSLYLPDVAIHGGAKGRRMNVTTRLSDPRERLAALVGVRIDTDDGDGGRSVRFRFTPSFISLDDRTWYIGARSILYEKPRVTVDNFRIYTGTAGSADELSVDGVISAEQSDTLKIRFDRFDLAPVGQFTEGAGYRPSGYATGYVDFISMLRHTGLNAGIDLTDLSVNGVAADPLRFTSRWEHAAEAVRFRMRDLARDADVLSGSFKPSTGRIDAVATLDGLDMSLLDPILKSAIENTSGTANARLTVGGTFRDLRLDGRIEIPRFETTVAFTKARYTLENGVMEARNSRLALPSTTVRDPLGNTAEFSLGVDLGNMHNVGFDIRATPHNLLAFNTGSGDNEAFYGQVFATGSLAIRGDMMGTKMNISATTGRGSKFFLPLNAKSGISRADFVVFADPGIVDTMNVLARKRLIYRRQLEAGSRTKPDKPLDLDMTIDLTPEAEFQMVIDPRLGHGITARGQGVLNMRVNPATGLFSMVGDCAISSGKFELSMLDVFNKEFTITPGSAITWTGEPEDALLDVEGIYRVRTSLVPLIGNDDNTSVRSVPVDCMLRLSGRLSQPEMTFDVRVPSTDIETRARIENAMNTQELKSTQFLALVMMGSFVPGSSLGQAGTVSSGGIGFDLLTSQLSNMLSTEDYNIYFRYSPQDETIGRGNEFDVGFSTGFIDDRLILEIEGNYVDDRASSSAGTGNVSNLAGDVSLTWVIDRAGNLRLKVFSQTIDRWNETQGEQESGLGIYYKKDFDTFRDVFGGNKDSFSKFGADSVGQRETKTKRKDKQQ